MLNISINNCIIIKLNVGHITCWAPIFLKSCLSNILHFYFGGIFFLSICINAYLVPYKKCTYYIVLKSGNRYYNIFVTVKICKVERKLRNSGGKTSWKQIHFSSIPQLIGKILADNFVQYSKGVKLRTQYTYIYNFPMNKQIDTIQVKVRSIFSRIFQISKKSFP